MRDKRNNGRHRYGVLPLVLRMKNIQSENWEAMNMQIITKTFAFIVAAAVVANGVASAMQQSATGDRPAPQSETEERSAAAECVDRKSNSTDNSNQLSNIFIQIKNPPADTRRPPGKSAKLKVNNCAPEDQIVGVMVGQPLVLQNHDGEAHNIVGEPKVNDEFNIGMPPTMKRTDKTFNKPEPLFKVKCDVHPWMSSYVAVMSHPYFAVTGEGGTFSIDGLPDGSYEIEAWGSNLPNQSGNVDIVDGQGKIGF